MQIAATNSTAQPVPVAILGVPFDIVTTEQTVTHIADMIGSRQPHYIATANVDFVVQALRDVELRRILLDAHLVLCDGMPLVWASRFLGNRLPERVAGSDLVPRLLAEAEQRGWRVFFLGGSETSVAVAAEKTRQRHPRLALVGAYSPPFKPLLQMDHEDILRRVREAKPDLLFVGFGCPKQEKWLNLHYRRAGVPVGIGVGGTIDFLAGTTQRAPVWMQRTGLEWIYRLLQEPRRLARRYGHDLSVFGVAILRQCWQMRTRRQRHSAATLPSVGIQSDLPRVAIITPPARLDAVAANREQPAWAKTAAVNHVILQMNGVEFADSTGIGALIQLQKQARAAHHGFVLAQPTAAVRNALRLMKLDELFVIVDAMSEARVRVTQMAGVRTEVGATSGAATTMRWSGEITASNADHVERSAAERLASLPAGATVTIDLSGVTFVDSGGVGMMVRLKKQLRLREITLQFVRPAPVVQNVLVFTRLDDYLTGTPP